MTESFKKHVASKDEKKNFFYCCWILLQYSTIINTDKLVSVVTSVLICSPHVNEGLSLFWGTRTPLQRSTS